MAKYDDIYPEAQPDFVSNRHNLFPPVVRWNPAESDNEAHECEVCGEGTFWLNPTSTQFVCSTECNEALWHQLMTIFVAQQIMTTLG